jgi:hypothetical protein
VEWRSWGRHASSAPSNCSADLGIADAWTDPARRTDMGGPATTAAVDAAAGASRTASGQLGCHRSSAGASLGRASARRAQGPRASASCAGAAATGRRTSAACADLGIAPSGSSAGRRGRSFVGRGPAGRSRSESSVE